MILILYLFRRLQDASDPNKFCISWAINPGDAFYPLVVFSSGRLLYVFNVEMRQITSQIRGHGGVYSFFIFKETTSYGGNRMAIGNHLDSSAPQNPEYYLHYV